MTYVHPDEHHFRRQRPGEKPQYAALWSHGRSLALYNDTIARKIDRVLVGYEPLDAVVNVCHDRDMVAVHTVSWLVRWLDAL